jgi:hypothetical protein
MASAGMIRGGHTSQRLRRAVKVGARAISPEGVLGVLILADERDFSDPVAVHTEDVDAALIHRGCPSRVAEKRTVVATRPPPRPPKGSRAGTSLR